MSWDKGGWLRSSRPPIPASRDVAVKDRPPGLLRLLWHAVLNPLVILLAVLATISFATGDLRAAVMMLP